MQQTEAIKHYKQTYFETALHTALAQNNLQDMLTSVCDELNKTFIEILTYQEEHDGDDIFSIEISYLISQLFLHKRAGYIEVYNENWYLSDPKITREFEFVGFFKDWDCLYRQAHLEAKKYIEKIPPYIVDNLFIKEVNRAINEITLHFEEIAEKVVNMDHFHKIRKKRKFYIAFGKLRRMRYYLDWNGETQKFIGNKV